MYAAIRPNAINRDVATILWRELLAISFTVFSTNLHPTEEPRINRQKLTVSSGNL